MSSDSFNFVVTPVNDEQVVAVNTGATVSEGSTGNVVSTAMLQTTDVDNTPGQLVYTVTGLTSNGTLRLSGTLLNVNDTFTQADIDAGLVTYDHGGSETTSDAFSFSVNDGQGSASSGGFNFVVTPVNDEQVVAVNTGATVSEGSTGNVISTAMLQTTDADDTPAQLTYTVTGLASNGTLRLNGTVLSVNDTFTQADIDAGLVTYDHDGGETTSDAFSFSVNDGQGAASSGAVQFRGHARQRRAGCVGEHRDNGFRRFDGQCDQHGHAANNRCGQRAVGTDLHGDRPDGQWNAVAEWNRAERE